MRVSTSSRSTRRSRCGKERSATADQHRVDHGPVLVDQTRRGRLGGEGRAADGDVAVPRLGSQPLDLLRQAAGGQAGIALHRRQRGGEHHLRERLPERGPLALRRRRASDPGRRSPSTASSRTAVVPAGGRRPLVCRRSRSERRPGRAPSSRSRRPARRCSRQARRSSNRSRCASGVLLGHGSTVQPPDAAGIIAAAGSPRPSHDGRARCSGNRTARTADRGARCGLPLRAIPARAGGAGPGTATATVVTVAATAMGAVCEPATLAGLRARVNGAGREPHGRCERRRRPLWLPSQTRAGRCAGHPRQSSMPARWPAGWRARCRRPC